MHVILDAESIEKFSASGLKHKKTLQFLFTSARISGKENLIERVAFTAKYVRGLMRVLKEGAKNPEVKNLDSVKTDVTENMNSITEQLRDIISESDQNDKNEFENTYLQLNADSFTNLNELIADLEWTKMYLNEMKRKRL